MFYSKKYFKFIEKLEINWEEVRNEYVQIVPSDLRKVLWGSAYGNFWKAYPLIVEGDKQKKYCKKFPKTIKLIKNIPGIHNASFLILDPRSHITPRIGCSYDMLRYYLEIVVPKNQDCAIRVGNKAHVWREGGSALFNNAAEYEIWNNGDKEGVVLSIDIKKKYYVDPAQISWSQLVEFYVHY